MWSPFASMTFLIRVRKHAHARAIPSLSMLTVTSVIWYLGVSLLATRCSLTFDSTTLHTKQSVGFKSGELRGTKYWAHTICRFRTHHACDFLAVWGKAEPCWNTYGEPLVILYIICFILISRPCMYASEWPFLRALKREGASRASSPETAHKIVACLPRMTAGTFSMQSKKHMRSLLLPFWSVVNGFHHWRSSSCPWHSTSASSAGAVRFLRAYLFPQCRATLRGVTPIRHH